MISDPRLQRLLALAEAALAAPPGASRRTLAILMGLLCHSVFAAAILSMIYHMFLGLSAGLGEVPKPWSVAVNLVLILQFPAAHSLLLTAAGRRLLSALVPGAHGGTLSSTSYAIVASLQLLVLFWLWTPSGIVWWRADDGAFLLASAAYALSWLFLGKAIYDAGADLQSGALGWLSLLAKQKPRYPDMPTLGLFRGIRQPIYLAFACTLWTVPVWTPDQLALALLWTAYCVAAPVLKERRYQALYGERFADYQRRVPYMIPTLWKPTANDD